MGYAVEVVVPHWGDDWATSLAKILLLVVLSLGAAAGKVLVMATSL